MTEITKEQVLARLSEIKDLEFVYIYFDGEGDSGAVTSIEYEKTDGSCSNRFAEEFDQLLEDFAYQVIDKAGHGGWGNGDGAFGKITITPSKRKVLLEISHRFIDFTTTNVEG